MTELRSARIAILIAVIALFSVAFANITVPHHAFAQDADAACKPKTDKNKDKKVNCKDTDGQSCKGESGEGKCQECKCRIQGGGPMPMIPMIPMPMPPMDMPMMPMDNCGQGGIGDATGGIVRKDEWNTKSSTTSTSTPSTNPNCPPENNTSQSWDPFGTGEQNVSSNIDTSSSEEEASKSVSDLFKDLFGDGSDDTGFKAENPNTEPTEGPTSTKANPYVGNKGIIEINPGVSGNIEFTDTGVTVLIHRESAGQTVAGFYGSDTTGAPQGLMQTWCATRPWATNFLSKIIPPTFFDTLCIIRGYKVGAVAAPTSKNSPRVETPKTTTVQTFNATSTRKTGKTIPKGPKRAAKVDIWAVPASVRLGARATVFWNATGVVSCEETSPEGGFTHTTLSGGAETVAISGATTFVISCLTDSGERVNNYTTINLAN